MNRIEVALRCGAAVEAVREIRKAERSFDGREYIQSLRDGRMRLELPDGTAEATWLRGVAPDTAGILLPARGVYCLAAHESTPPLGTVRRLTVHPGEGGQDEFSRGCQRGLLASSAWLEPLTGRRPSRSYCFVASTLGVPDAKGLAEVGRSAGLAAALAHACAEVGEDILCVAATGEVDSDGRVLPVAHLEEKLAALARETPFVTRVYVPAGQRCVLPTGTRGRLAVVPVESVADALRSLLGDGQLDARARSALVDDVFALRVGPEKGDAAHLRLTWPVTFDPAGQTPAGWRLVEGEEQTRLFSRLDLERLAIRTSLLHWRTAGSQDVPLAYRLDMVELAEAVLVGEGLPKVRVESLELLPVRDPRRPRAWLGLRLAIGPCDVRELLTAISTRVFGKVSLALRGGSRATIAGLVRAVQVGLERSERPRFADAAVERHLPGMLPVVMQVVLPASHDWPVDERWVERAGSTRPPPDALGLLWSLLSTRSLPSREYPKSAGPAPWVLPEALETLHGIGTQAVTILARDDAKGFNARQKPNMVMEAYWFLYLLAHELRARPDDQMEREIEAACTMATRSAFFRRCCDSFKGPRS